MSNKSRSKWGKVLGWVGNATLIFSVASTIAHLQSIEEALAHVGQFGTEVLFTVNRLLVPWRMLSGYIIDMLPFDLPYYALDSTILVLALLFLFYGIAANYAVNGRMRRTWLRFKESKFSLFQESLTLDNIDSKSDEIIARLDSDIKLWVFPHLLGPPLELLLYRFNKQIQQRQINYLQSNTLAYLSELDKAYTEMFTQSLKYRKKNIRKALIAIVVVLFLVVDTYVYESDVVLFKILLYGLILTIVLLLIDFILYAGPFIVILIVSLFKYRRGKQRMKYAIEAINKFPSLSLTKMFNSDWQLKDHLPDEYMVYDGNKRDNQFFTDMMVGGISKSIE